MSEEKRDNMMPGMNMTAVYQWKGKATLRRETGSWLFSQTTTCIVYWDIMITMLLLYSCFVTTLQMALYEELSLNWKVINWSVDTLFFIDILVIFNTVIEDEEAMIYVESRSQIACTYLKGWFLVDFIAIIPFELMVPHGDSASIVRYIRLGRLYKFLKLLKLIRLMKL